MDWSIGNFAAPDLAMDRPVLLLTEPGFPPLSQL
jgi:hypothetical protein